MAEPDTLLAERDRPAVPRHRTDWRRLADGLLLIGLGVFVLLNTTGHLPWTFWYDALTLWPIMLVSAGLRIAVDRTRVAWLMVLGPLVVLATLAGVAGGRLDNAPGPWQPVAAERPSDATGLTLRAALASSRVEVAARALGDGTLLEGRQGSRMNKARIETKVEGGDATVTLVPGDNGWDAFRPGRLSRWELGVSDALPVTIDLDGAMIGARYDLGRGQVAGATFDGAFLGIDLHLPKPAQRIKLQIHGVFNMVDVFAPPGTPVRVHGPGFPFNLVDRGSGDPKDPATPGYDVEFAGVFCRIGVTPEGAPAP
jgi:LiaI-LiaF-like transmembrane region